MIEAYNALNPGQVTVDDAPTETTTLDSRETIDASPDTIEAAVSSLERRKLDLRGDINRASRVADQMAPLRDACGRLMKQAESLHPAALPDRLARLRVEARQLYQSTRGTDAEVASTPGEDGILETLSPWDESPLTEPAGEVVADSLPAIPDTSIQLSLSEDSQTGIIAGEGGERAVATLVDRPKMTDVVKTLPRHPKLKPYPRRTGAPTMIVIHHTDTPPNFTVEQIARYHVYGERRDSDGSLIKGPWPGIGYHFVIAADGTIYRCQDEMTRSYHVGGTANDVAIGVALIGRFMARDYSGKLQKADLQIPGEKQLTSAGRLAAWLMQQYKINVARVLGHKNVWPHSTACPGEFWSSGASWKNRLIKEIQSAQDPHTTRQIEHYLLFWDQGAQWAQADWHNAQPYIARFRPTCGFSAEDALLARRVTIVGGPAGVSGGIEAKFRAAGIVVHRLAGRTEAETKALLDALVAKGTPWPGATPRGLDESSSGDEEGIAEDQGLITSTDADLRQGVLADYQGDEWTVPDDWEAA